MKLLDYAHIHDQDTVKVPVASNYTQHQDRKPGKQKLDWMTLIRAVSLTLTLLLLFGSMLILFSYPNQLSAFFAPKPTPVYPQCAYGTYSMIDGTPIVYFSEVCK